MKVDIGKAILLYIVIMVIISIITTISIINIIHVYQAPTTMIKEEQIMIAPGIMYASTSDKLYIDVKEYELNKSEDIAYEDVIKNYSNSHELDLEHATKRVCNNGCLTTVRDHRFDVN